ncbi:MAG: hypothetical protein JOZ96_03540 [Acidobacteria bacterium]|nr:hypothetical protein [Acidobacteriota bacterium]
MAGSSKAEELERQARFVFIGTVRRLKAATMPEIKKSERERTVVVRVDQIIQTPPLYKNRTGQEITVQLKKGERVRVGQQAQFYTNGWLVGNESVAVTSLGHVAVPKGGAALRAATLDPVRSLAFRDARARVDDADIVCSGTVKSVQLPQGESRSLAAAPSVPPLSEHDPMWQEAVVEVNDVHKGPQGRKDVVIRFPSSKDRMWADAPKFRPGQSGFFVLHRAASGGAPHERAALLSHGEESAEGEYYTALHPEDFQPFGRESALREVLGAPEDPGEN